MAYLGNRPAEAYSAFQKQDFTTSATTSYTLDHPVANQNEIALFINFVRQEPTAAYTASGTTLTLTSATSSSDDMYCIYLGKAVQTVNPPSGSVGSSQVAASIITGQTALGATPADTDELLISDAGTLKRVDYSYLKSANTPAFRAYMGSTQTISTTSGTKLNFDTESYDIGSNYDTSNYRFTPTTAGKYLITASIRLSGNVTITNCQLYIYKNGSVYNRSTQGFNGDSSPMLTNTDTVEMNGSSDYIELYFYHNQGSNLDISGSVQNTYFNGFRIIGA